MPTQVETNPFPYSDSNKRYYSYDYFLRRKFGAKCAKLPLDGGFTCPNRDGTRGVGGCIYCSERGSGDFCSDSSLDILSQLRDAYARLSKKWESPKCIAYFQAFTNTYAPLSVLREKYESALTFPEVVGISVATRADCLADDVCEYLAELAERTFLTVELGLQTVHDSTAAYINRGHTFAEFVSGYEKLRNASGKINIGVHLINGLPHETAEMMLESAREVAKLRPDQLKLHLLHVIEGTELASIYRSGEFECLTLEEYADIVVRQLEIMPRETVIGRLTGDGMADTLIAPEWSRKKLVVMNTIDKLMFERDTWQGKYTL
ncbi:MAG: TIGR01212 family radical SAM protein [Clostridia bacterium]|nr:TIGR01212 family radical SAM protein [Clostridia bacterium]